MEHVETVIVGAGQAGLATAYHLKRRGRDCLVLDAHQRVGDNWRRLWDSLRLYSPAQYDALPGLPFPAKKWACPGKDEVADYLEQYAAHHDLPVRARRPRRDGHPRRRPLRRPHQRGRPPRATTSWSPPAPSAAPRPSRTSPVISTRGSCSCTPASTGVPASSPTAPCSSSAPPTPGATSPTRSPRAGRRSWPVVTWVRSRSRSSPDGPGCSGRRSRSPGATSSPGARRWDARRWPRSGSTAGRCCGSVATTSRRAGSTGARTAWSASRTAGRCSPTGRVLDVATVVWCTGYRQDFGWLDLPVIGEDGWPKEFRGVVDGRAGAVLLRPVLPVRLQLHGAARRGPRRGPRRRAPRGRMRPRAAVRRPRRRRGPPDRGRGRAERRLPSLRDRRTLQVWVCWRTCGRHGRPTSAAISGRRSRPGRAPTGARSTPGASSTSPTRALLIGDHETAQVAMRAAFDRNVAEGAFGPAVRCAFYLAMRGGTSGDAAQAGAWAAARERILERAPGPRRARLPHVPADVRARDGRRLRRGRSAGRRGGGDRPRAP